MRLKRLSLAQRLFVSIVVAIAPAFGVIVYNEFRAREARTIETNEQATRAAQLASLELDRIMGGFEGVLAVTAAMPSVRGFETEACSQRLAEVISRMPALTAIGVVDASGQLRCRSAAPTSGVSLAERPYFSQAMQARAFVIGEYVPKTISGEPSLPLAMPMLDGAGAVTGVVVAGLKIDWLGQRLRERGLTGNSALTVADRAGVIIGREPFAERFVGTRIPDAFLPLLSASEPGTLRVRSQDGTRRVLGYHPATITGTGLYVSAGIAEKDAFATIADATRRNVAVAVAVALLAMLLSWYAAETLIRRPIRRLGGAIAAWRAGDHAARTGMRPRDDIQALGVAIDDFMDELVATRKAQLAAEQHRQLLVEELTHRVKNLLATVQSVARQSLRNSDRAELDAFLGRLSAMADTHSLLVSSQWSRARLHDVVATAIGTFGEGGHERFEIAGPDLMIRPRATLTIAMALHELCTNAVKYGALGAERGRVAVSWEAKDGRFELCWRERDGPPVAPVTDSGFGTRMLKRVFAAEMDASVELDFPATGLVFRASAPLDAVVEPGPQPEAERRRPALHPAA